GPLSRVRSRQAARKLTHLTGPCRAWAVPGVGLRVTSDRSTGHVPWARFVRVRETRRAFHLFTPGLAVLPAILAKRGLAAPTQVGRLRGLLERDITTTR